MGFLAMGDYLLNNPTTSSQVFTGKYLFQICKQLFFWIGISCWFFLTIFSSHLIIACWRIYIPRMPPILYKRFTLFYVARPQIYTHLLFKGGRRFWFLTRIVQCDFLILQSKWGLFNVWILVDYLYNQSSLSVCGLPKCN